MLLIEVGVLVSQFPDHAIMDAAPLLPLPKWLVDPLRYYQSANVWTCYHWTGFWRWVFHSHYFDVLLDECRKVWPYGKGKAVREGYKDVYTKMNHGQLLVDCPEEVARRILDALAK